MKKGNYRPNPSIEINLTDVHLFDGFKEIRQKLHTECENCRVIAVETYPQTDKQALLKGLDDGTWNRIFDTDTVLKSGIELDDFLQDDLTDDRVFGKLTHKRISDLIVKEKFELMQEEIRQEQGTTLLIGFGSSLLVKPDMILFTSVTRWESQLRFRRKTADNFNAGNFGEDPLRMFKRGYFVDWRIADRHKAAIWDQVDYVIDTDSVDHPKMISQSDYMRVLAQVVQAPFSTVPYFDAGVWGGQWMKEVCNLPQDKVNYAWSFNGVPEENALLLKIETITICVPASDAVLFFPRQLMGDLNVARFGNEFPIRFDFLDTMKGGHLSLQVHPLTDYIQKTFGMPYTQDESYYILDAKEDACVYLGVKEGVQLKPLMEALNAANNGGDPFEDETFINHFSAKKHDHFLIPAGTIHCSGKNSVVLEISATPYIFTFKLWDWGRVGMDGRPRPVHLDHAKHVIQTERSTSWVKKNLINAVTSCRTEEGLREERTGLHELEFIDTIRSWFNRPFNVITGNTVQLIMLVEGESAVISSPTHQFAPQTFYYAECIIIPATVGEYVITPSESSQTEMGLLRAYVRGTLKKGGNQ